jgi:calcineurin-like phosphoesterase family protein
MTNIWLTSDLHFSHDQPFIWGSRGFNSIEEHDEAIIENWNKVVKEDDIVYCLGDLMLKDNERGMEKILRLNGKIYVAYGNHDTLARIEIYNELPNIYEVQMGYRFSTGKKQFILSHYPQLVANYKDIKPIFSLHGHTHSQDKWSDVFHAYNVNLDAHNCTPVNLEQIIDDINIKRNKGEI